MSLLHFHLRVEITSLSIRQRHKYENMNLDSSNLILNLIHIDNVMSSSYIISWTFCNPNSPHTPKFSTQNLPYAHTHKNNLLLCLNEFQ